MVAIESRKQAASRPRPPLPSPASGSCSSRPSQSSRFSADDLPGDRLEQQVHDVVRERAADQELHRQVVDALRVLALVGLLGADPPLRQHVAHRARDRLEALARPGGRRVADAVEEQMALVERIGGARELDGAAAVLREQVRRRGRGAVEAGRSDGSCARAGPSWACFYSSPSRSSVYVNPSTIRPSTFPALRSDSTRLISSRRAS